MRIVTLLLASIAVVPSLRAADPPVPPPATAAVSDASDVPGSIQFVPVSPLLIVQPVDPAEAKAKSDAALAAREPLIRELPPVRGDVASGATSINDKGQIVGWSRSPSGFLRAVIWVRGFPALLGVPSDVPSVANDINSAGDAVGHRGPNGALWTSSRGSYDLGPGDAVIVDDDGVAIVVDHGRNYVWMKSGRVETTIQVPKHEEIKVTLPEGWTLLSANSRNAGGAIVGVARHQGKERAFVLQPKR